MLKKETVLARDFLSNFRFIPRKIYIIAIVAVVSSIITVAAEYTFALLLQVYIHFLGFIPKDQINKFLLPLADKPSLAFIVLVTAIVLGGGSTFIQTYINIAFSETFIYEARKKLLYNLFRPNTPWHYDLGTTSNIMAEVIPKGANFITAFARFLVLLIQVAGIGVLCLLSLPRQFFICLLIFAAMGPFIIYLNKKSRHYGSKILERSQRLNMQLMKSIKNLVFIKILGLEHKERDNTIILAGDYYRHFLKSNWFYSMAHSIPVTFGTIGAIFLFYLFNTEGVSKASLLTMFYLLYRFVQDLSSTIAITNGLNIYYPNFKSIMQILRREYDEETNLIPDSIKPGIIDKLPETIILTVKNLTFSYNALQKDNIIFKDISSRLIPGQLLVVKGASGSGKSTFLMNLIGILRPVSGSIFWSGIEFDKLDRDIFKRNIGYMGPEPYIISGTVYDNLCYGLHEKPTEEELITACKLAQAHDFIISSRSGFNTVLTEQGEGLSMGQKQRLGLARALLRKPRILVLDEITANLDHDTETAVVDNIAKLKSKMVVLVATHSRAFDRVGDIFVNLGAIE